MKVLLTLAFLLNAALVALLGWRPSLAPPGVRDFIQRHVHAAPASTSAVTHVERARPAAAAATLWPKITADDLPTLIARLRAAGFPAATIRAIVQAQVSARYNPRIRALQEPDPNLPFWKAASSIHAAGDKRMVDTAQLQRERAKLLRDLLSDPFFATADVSLGQRRQFGDLPRSKIDALQRIEDDYAEMNGAIRAVMNGIVLPEDREKLALLAREKHDDLAAVLTPQELADYEMRSSPTTNMLRSNLANFDATEAEFRVIFQAQVAYGEKLPAGPFGGGDFQLRQAAGQQLNQQLKAGLGDARYADYLRETNRDFQQLHRQAEREHLPPGVDVNAFNLRDSVALESNRIFDDPALDADQKRAALQALAQNTRAQLNQMLGPVVGPSYVKMADSNWLARMESGAAVLFNGGPNFTTSNSSTGAMAAFGVSPSYRMLPRAQPPSVPVQRNP